MNLSINWTVFITLLILLVAPSLVLFNYSTKQTKNIVYIGIFIYLCVIVWFFQDKLFIRDIEVFYMNKNNGGNSSVQPNNNFNLNNLLNMNPSNNRINRNSNNGNNGINRNSNNGNRNSNNGINRNSNNSNNGINRNGNRNSNNGINRNSNNGNRNSNNGNRNSNNGNRNSNNGNSNGNGNEYFMSRRGCRR